MFIKNPVCPSSGDIESSSQRQKGEWWLCGLRGRGWELVFNRDIVSVLQDEKFLEMEVVIVSQQPDCT